MHIRVAFVFMESSTPEILRFLLYVYIPQVFHSTSIIVVIFLRMRAQYSQCFDCLLSFGFHLEICFFNEVYVGGGGFR